MTKLAYYTVAAAALLAVGAANAEGTKHEKTTGIGAAVSNTAGAAYEKSAQGVNSVKGSYHANMAESNAESAKENLANGNLNDAATDAKDAAEHQAMAIDAKDKAAANKSKASKDWANAKAAVSTSGTTR